MLFWFIHAQYISICNICIFVCYILGMLYVCMHVYEDIFASSYVICFQASIGNIGIYIHTNKRKHIHTRQAGSPSKIVCSTGEHTCAILDSGEAKCWGANNNGQLGLGDSQARGDGPNEMGSYLPVINLGTVSESAKILSTLLTIFISADYWHAWISGINGLTILQQRW